MAFTKIEWTDMVWNPWWGCDHVGHECDHCYAEWAARRNVQAHMKGVVEGGGWTGEIKLASEAAWKAPVKWRVRRVFTCSMSDFWHPEVPLLALGRALDVIEATPHLTYQVLSKRPGNIQRRLDRLGRTLPANVWLGLTVGHEDSLPLLKPFQALRMPNLKFLSVEPLLTPLPKLELAGIGWVIVGGESGPGARPMHPDWVRDIRDRCGEKKIPFFFKQWGHWRNNPVPPTRDLSPHAKGGATLDGQLWQEFPD